jgi:hypothetical protein
MDTTTAPVPEITPSLSSSASAWLTGPVASSIGLVMGAVGIGLAVYFYFRQKRERLPRYMLSTSVIISPDHKRQVDDPDKLTVLWDSKPVRQLAVSTVLLGNSGNDPIRGEDLPEGEPTLLLLADGEILDYSVLETSAPGIEPRIDRVDERRLRLRFAYLDSRDAIKIRIIHTEATTAPLVSGYVIGAGRWRDVGVVSLAGLSLRSLTIVIAGNLASTLGVVMLIKLGASNSQAALFFIALGLSLGYSVYKFFLRETLFPHSSNQAGLKVKLHS